MNAHVLYASAHREQVTTCMCRVLLAPIWMFYVGTEAFHLAAMLAPNGGRVFACGVNEDQLEELVKRKEMLNADSIRNTSSGSGGGKDAYHWLLGVTLLM